MRVEILEASLVLFWIGFGVATFAAIDAEQMKKQIPYGDIPAILSLRHIRIMCLIISAAVGLPLFLGLLGTGKLWKDE